MALHMTGELSSLFHAAPELFKRCLRPNQKALTEWRQHDSARVPLTQRAAHFLLKLAQASRQCGLRQAQAARSTSHALGTGNRNKVA